MSVREAPVRTPRPSRSLTGWLVLAVSVPFVLGVVQVLAAARDPFYLFGDEARVAVAVERSLQLLQLTGPYSRFGWDHPGPLYYYFLAPGTLLLPGGLGVYLGALLSNWLFALAAVVLAARSTRPRTALCLTVVVALVLLVLGEAVLNDPWNPAVVVLPLLAAMIGAAVRPTVASMCLVVVGCSLAFQAHVGTVSVVATIGLVVAGRHLARWRGGQPLLPATRSTLIVGGVTVLCWLLPFVEQLRGGRDGNFGRVVHFNLTGEGERQTLETAARTVIGAAWLPDAPAVVPVPAVPGPVWLWLAAWTAAGALGCVLAWRRQLRVALVLHALALVGLAVVTLALSRVVGPLEVYLLWWVPLPFVALLGGWLVLLLGDGGLLPHGRVVATTALAVLVAATVVASVGGPLSRTGSSPTVGAASRLILGQLDRPGAVALDAPDPEVLPAVNGIAATLLGQDRAIVTPGRENVYRTRGSSDPVATFRVARAGSGSDTGGTLLGVVPGQPDLTVRLLPGSG